MVKTQKLENPGYYINREWSWLEFNSRVLYEAAETENPLLERLKFLSIVTSNLEEFFMVRVAGLKKLHAAGLRGNAADGKTPAEQLAGIRKKVVQMLNDQYHLFFKSIIPLLEKNGIHLILSSKKVAEYKSKLETIFRENIFPVITPISVSPTHPFPNLVTEKIYLAVELDNQSSLEKKIETSKYSFIEIPVKIYGRFIEIEKQVFIPIEYVARLFIDEIYQNYTIKSCHFVRITRDADFDIAEDAISDLLAAMESKIKKMHIRSVVKLEYEKGLPESILNLLKSNYNLSEDYIYSIKKILDLKSLMELYLKIDRVDLKDAVSAPVIPKNFDKKNIMNMIQQNDFILYHPYHSYEPVLQLLETAAGDPDVLAIKQLLYRTGTYSRIIKALIKAAENGIHVTVVVELKARFDERQNIEWAKQLEDAGAHVIYGLSGLKTHAKALLIVKREKKRIRRYIHVATGNYNENTARLYTDCSFFTCDDNFGADISVLFNLLTGFSLPTNWHQITIAPLNLRDKFISLIKRETENAKKGLKSKIIAKMNSLSDKGIAQTLYEASCAGVKIRLIVRGISIAIPGLKDVSENIKITSIIGKYLEHARIYYFHNAGKSEYYLSSADWMTRNLDRRIELLFPVYSKSVQDFIMKILNSQLEDTVNSWEMNKDGHYEHVNSKNKNDSFIKIYDSIQKSEKPDKNVKELFQVKKSPN